MRLHTFQGKGLIVTVAVYFPGWKGTLCGALRNALLVPLREYNRRAEDGYGNNRGGRWYHCYGMQTTAAMLPASLLRPAALKQSLRNPPSTATVDAWPGYRKMS